MNKEGLNDLVKVAVDGSHEAMELIIQEIQDSIFTLALRMLGTISDAEDATQDILVRVITNLSSFREEAGLKTWVYRIAVNHLLDYKKSMFYERPLDFELYGTDIATGYIENTQQLLDGQSETLLAKELKLSCTNVMLQCLDAQSRCIFILGTIFKIDSRVGAEVMGITAESYRQKLSRARKRMSMFLQNYCGLTDTGQCNCHKRVGYAINSQRLRPQHLEYSNLETLDMRTLQKYTNMMNELDGQVPVFEELPGYRTSDNVKTFIRTLMKSSEMREIYNF